MFLTFLGSTVNTLNEEVLCVWFLSSFTQSLAPYMLLTKGVMREIKCLKCQT